MSEIINLGGDELVPEKRIRERPDLDMISDAELAVFLVNRRTDLENIENMLHDYKDGVAPDHWDDDWRQSARTALSYARRDVVAAKQQKALRIIATRVEHGYLNA